MSDAKFYAIKSLLTKARTLEDELESEAPEVAATMDPVLEEGVDPEVVALQGAAEVSGAPYTLESLAARVEELEELVSLVGGSTLPGEDPVADAEAVGDDAALLAAGIVLAGDDASVGAAVGDGGVDEEDPEVDFDDLDDDPEEKAAPSVCPECGSTEFDEFEDGLTVCSSCGAELAAAAPSPVEEEKAWGDLDSKSWDAAASSLTSAAEMAELLARRDQLGV